MDLKIREQTRDEVIQKSRELRLASDRQWQRILFYNETLFESNQSQIDDPSFFLSPEGSRNPQKELEAFIFRVFEGSSLGIEKMTVQCRYPARWQWLKSKFSHRQNWPEYLCPAFEEFKSRVAAKSVSMVFSSYYVNNPASSFGHTLLRLNKSEPGKRDQQELLDYGINYAANPTTSNPLLYTFAGLFGFFEGVFTAVPYFHKVREYNDFESRDLWSYDLKLDQAAVDFLVALIWELAPTKINYWYLTENCSYHMLSMLDAADPALDLRRNLKKWIIPVDTLKAVTDVPGFVTGIHFRPSASTTYFSSRDQLSPVEKSIFFRLVQNADFDALKALSTVEERAKVLEVGFDFLDYMAFEKLTITAKHPEPTPEKILKDRLLLERAKLAVGPQLRPAPRPELEAPHLAHDSRRIGLSLRSRHDNAANNFVDGVLEYRFALHGLEDPISGYPRDSEIRFFDLAFQMRDVKLERLILFEVVSLAETRPEDPKVSWQFRFGYDRTSFSMCGSSCSNLVIAGSFGQTYRLHKSTTISGHLQLASEGGSPESYGQARLGRLNGVMAGIGPQLRLRTIWTENLISSFEGSYQYATWPLEASGRLRFQIQGRIANDFALSLEAVKILAEDQSAQLDEATIGLRYFY
ncbi:MAG: DUF4105 domain-containing protein [Bdellovibrionales bacterium]|nr:DUF4105 domain-containing protein [Bdellovibrionales bacterium]